MGCARGPCGPSDFRAAMKPDRPRRNGYGRRFSPSAPRAEFLARQNRRPPPSSALATARSASRVLARPARLLLSRTRGTDGTSRRPEENGKRNEPMNTIAEFTIIGRVGEIKKVGTTAARQHRLEPQPKGQSRRMDRAHPLERSHHLQRNDPRLRQTQHRQGRPRLHLGFARADEVGEGRRDLLRRHARRRAHRAPVQGPEPRRRQGTTSRRSSRPPGTTGRYPVLIVSQAGEASASPALSPSHRERYSTGAAPARAQLSILELRSLPRSPCPKGRPDPACPSPKPPT